VSEKRKRGRPALPPQDVAAIPTMTRLTLDESMALYELAAAAGVTPSKFLRSVFVDYLQSITPHTAVAIPLGSSGEGG
jgi:hypothetical protein